MSERVKRLNEFLLTQWLRYIIRFNDKHPTSASRLNAADAFKILENHRGKDNLAVFFDSDELPGSIADWMAINIRRELVTGCVLHHRRYAITYVRFAITSPSVAIPIYREPYL